MKNKWLVLILFLTLFSMSGIVSLVNEHKSYSSYYYEKINKNFMKKFEGLKFDFKKEEPIELKQEVKIPILMYHGVLDNPWGISSLFLKVSEFEEQMKYLKDNGYTPIFLDEINTLGKRVEKPIIITFDDGYQDVYVNAFPILKKYNFKAHFYIITDWINGDVYMNKEELMEINDSKLIKLGSHTLNHAVLAKLSDDQVEYQLKNSKQNLEELLGKEVTSIAYPTGSFDERVKRIAQKYYKYGLSTISGIETFNKDTDLFAIKRLYVVRGQSLDEFIESIS